MQTPRRKINFANRASVVQTPETVQNERNTSATLNQGKKSNSILNGIEINRDDFSERDFQHLQSIKEKAPSLKESKKMNINSLMDDMKLSASDRTFIVNEMNAINNNKNNSNKSSTIDDPFSRLERVLSQDSSIMVLLDQWTKEVESTLGKSIVDPTSLSEEELKKIQPAPEKLQEVIKFMFFGDK